MNTAEPKPRALVSPDADFWLVGGLSLAAFAAFVLITEVAGIVPQRGQYFWVFYASFIISNPHFIYSYLLFYRGFWTRLTSKETEPLSRLRMIVAGFAVPTVMAGFAGYALAYPDPRYAHWALNAMVFSLGWHYVKQGYGVLITLSLYEGVLYDAAEKRILWLNAYAMWIYSWICSIVYGVDLFNPVGMPPDHTNPLPAGADKPALLGIVIALPAAVTLVRHWRRTGGMAVNAVMGYACAAWMWIMMPFINPLFIYIIPLFHGLQYLPFVFKMKKSEFRGEQATAKGSAARLRDARLRVAVFTLLGLALSVLIFESLPKYLGGISAARHPGLSDSFSLLTLMSFVNIHHFFMDSAFWRRDNAEVQKNLFHA